MSRPEYLDPRAVDRDPAFLGEGAELFVHGLAAGAEHLSEIALGDVELDGRNVFFNPAVEERHFADDLAVLEEVDRRLAAVLGSQVDADNARGDDIEAVRFVALLEQRVVRMQRHLAGNARQPPYVVWIEAIEEHGPPEP